MRLVVYSVHRLPSTKASALSAAPVWKMQLWRDLHWLREIGGKRSMSEITLTVNGREVTVPEGSTILDAAKKLDIWIPTLCHMHLHGTEMDNHPASCRVCVVEVKGRRTLMPSCATPVAEGMEVITNSARVLQARSHHCRTFDFRPP